MKRTLKVLLVTPDYPPALGGVQSLLYNITRSLPDSECRVVTLNHPNAVEFDQSCSQKILRLGASVKSAPVRNIIFNIAAAFVQSDWVPDVVLNGHVVTAPVSAWLAKRFTAKSVCYLYGKEIDGRPGMTAWALKHLDRAIAVSEFTRTNALGTLDGRLETTSVSVIHPGVSVPRETCHMKADRPTILTTGRLRDFYKGHDQILYALPKVIKKVPNAQWIVIGGGQLQSILERRAQSSGLADHVKFLGAASDEVRDQWLSKSHVFAMPARYPRDEIGGEGFPVVYLEAAAWGLPAIAGNVGGPKEAVLHGQTGLLVDPENPEEIATSLIQLLEDTQYASELGANAYRRVSREFQWSYVGAQLENVLRDVCGMHLL